MLSQINPRRSYHTTPEEIRITGECHAIEDAFSVVDEMDHSTERFITGVKSFQYWYSLEMSLYTFYPMLFDRVDSYDEFSDYRI